MQLQEDFIIDIVNLPFSINKSYWLFNIYDDEFEIRFHLTHLDCLFEIYDSNFLINIKINKNYFRKFNIDLTLNGQHINKINCATQCKLCELITNKQENLSRRLFEESTILFILSQLAEEGNGSVVCKNCIYQNRVENIRIQKIQEYIQNNISQHLTIAKLAILAGTNQCYLKKGFKEFTNKTIFEYILDERMNKAKDLILRQNLPISEVASLVGYASTSSFSQSFKNYFGTAPSQFSLKLK